MIFLGADGGGTGTTVAAYENGVLLGKTEVGPLNYRFISPEDAAHTLAEGIRALGTDPGRIAALGIADPSLDDRVSEEDEAAARFYGELRRTLSFPVYGRSDAYITLYGLTGGNGPGVLMISGTGAMGIAENGRGEIRVAGGWGRLTGDEGSGYYIASEGIRAALRASEGAGPATALTEALKEHFGVRELRALIGVFYGSPEPDIASFAGQVARQADRGDKESLRILEEAAAFLAAYAAPLVRWSGCRRVGIYGSVLLKNARVRERFIELLARRFGEIAVEIPPIPVEEAAALYAQAALKKEKEKTT